MTEIKVFEAISIVTFNDVPASKVNEFMSDIFSRAENAKISVDMISQAPSTSDKISFGFTFGDEDVPKLLPIINSVFESKVSAPLINCGNIKIVIKSREMTDGVGFAAKVFAALQTVSCVPLLVTTGIDEISLLVYESDRTDIVNELNKLFA